MDCLIVGGLSCDDSNPQYGIGLGGTMDIAGPEMIPVSVAIIAVGGYMMYDGLNQADECIKRSKGDWDRYNAESSWIN